MDPGKSKVYVVGILDKLQKMAEKNMKKWQNEKIDQNLLKRYLSRILIQRSTM